MKGKVFPKKAGDSFPFFRVRNEGAACLYRGVDRNRSEDRTPRFHGPVCRRLRRVHVGGPGGSGVPATIRLRSVQGVVCRKSSGRAVGKAGALEDSVA